MIGRSDLPVTNDDKDKSIDEGVVPREIVTPREDEHRGVVPREVVKIPNGGEKVPVEKKEG